MRGGHLQRDGTNLGVLVPIWLILLRSEATNLGLCNLSHSPHSNGAVQIRVGLELADILPKLDPGLLIYVSPVGGLQDYFY